MESFTNTSLTIGIVVAAVGAGLSIVKAIDWLGKKIDGAIIAAVAPITLELALLKVALNKVADDARAFELRALQTFVQSDVIQRLEARMDKGFADLRADLKDAFRHERSGKGEA